MPGEDGASLLRFVRDNFQSMARVILTALADDQALKEASDSAHHTFIKPCGIEDILAAIEETRKNMQ